MLNSHYSYEPREKTTPTFPSYLLFNRDPYNSLFQSRYHWVGFHLLYIHYPTKVFSLLICLHPNEVDACRSFEVYC